MNGPGAGVQKKVVQRNTVRPSVAADQELQAAFQRLVETFVHKFGAIHFIVAEKVEEQVETKSGGIILRYNFFQPAGFEAVDFVTEYAEAVIIYRIAETVERFAFQPLAWIVVTADGVVNKNTVVFDHEQPAMRITGIVFIHAACGSTHFIGAVAEDEIAIMHQLRSGMDSLVLF